MFLLPGKANKEDNHKDGQARDSWFELQAC